MSLRSRLRGMPPAARMWAVVIKNGPTYSGRGNCWVKPGVGEWYVKVGSRQVRANRLSWELHNGPIPAGLEVCHHCDNPACIRPSHLFLGTHKQNMDDMVSKRRGKGGVTGSNNSSTKYPHLRQGDRNGHRKLDSADVVRMRSDWKTRRHTYKTLSAKYNVSEVTVNRIVNNRAWKHV